MSDDGSYQKMKLITDGYYSGRINKGWSSLVVGLLNEHGIKLRNKDGKLYQVNVSLPKTKSNSIVVGLRYIKEDNTFTEDLFLFENGFNLKAFYKAKLENILPEYKGTHKLRLSAHV